MKKTLCLAVLFSCLVANALAQRGEFVPPAKSGSRKPIVNAPFLKASEVTDQVTAGPQARGGALPGSLPPGVHPQGRLAGYWRRAAGRPRWRGGGRKTAMHRRH